MMYLYIALAFFIAGVLLETFRGVAFKYTWREWVIMIMLSLVWPITAVFIISVIFRDDR